MVEQESPAAIDRQALEGVGELQTGDRLLASPSTLRFRDHEEPRGLWRLPSVHCANVHEEDVPGNRVHPWPHGQTPQVPSPRSVNLKERILEKVVDAMGVVASRTEKAAQLLFERKVESIEPVQLAVLIRGHQVAQIVVVRPVITRRFPH